MVIGPRDSTSNSSNVERRRSSAPARPTVSSGVGFSRIWTKVIPGEIPKNRLLIGAAADEPVRA